MAASVFNSGVELARARTMFQGMNERRRGQDVRRVLGGAVAGAAGTVVLTLVESIEIRALGAAPVYTSTRVAARLAARIGVTLNDDDSRRAGRLLRWTYGPALGMVRSWLAGRSAALASWISFAVAIYAFELVVLPAVGATPPLRRWPRAQIGSLALHTAGFAVAATVVGRGLEAPAWQRRAFRQHL
jgi:hypothetical protein